jgi:hypothetical protein
MIFGTLRPLRARAPRLHRISYRSIEYRIVCVRARAPRLHRISYRSIEYRIVCVRPASESVSSHRQLHCRQQRPTHRRGDRVCQGFALFPTLITDTTDRPTRLRPSSGSGDPRLFAGCLSARLYPCVCPQIADPDDAEGAPATHAHTHTHTHTCDTHTHTPCESKLRNNTPYSSGYAGYANNE